MQQPDGHAITLLYEVKPGWKQDLNLVENYQVKALLYDEMMNNSWFMKYSGGRLAEYFMNQLLLTYVEGVRLSEYSKPRELILLLFFLQVYLKLEEKRAMSFLVSPIREQLQNKVFFEIVNMYI